jgi:hypothetical protein
VSGRAKYVLRRYGSHFDVCLTNRIVSRHSSAEIERSADIKMIRVGLTLENIKVYELIHFYWPAESKLAACGKPKRARLH